MPKAISKTRNQHRGDFGMIAADELHARLRQFKVDLIKVSEGKKILNESPSLTRRRLLTTLKVVSEFVHELTCEPLENDIVISSHATGLIERLIIAIQELSYGIVDPVLCRNKSHNRTVLPTAQHKQQQSIAADFKILRRKKYSESKCYQKLAQIYDMDQKKIRSHVKNYPKSKARRIQRAV